MLEDNWCSPVNCHHGGAAELVEHSEEPQFEGFELHGGSLFDVQSTWVQDVDLLWLNITLWSFFLLGT